MVASLNICINRSVAAPLRKQNVTWLIRACCAGSSTPAHGRMLSSRSDVTKNWDWGLWWWNYCWTGSSESWLMKPLSLFLLLPAHFLKSELILLHLHCGPVSVYKDRVDERSKFCCDGAWRCRLFMLNDPWGWNHQAACRRRTVALLCEHVISVLLDNISLASLSFQFETALCCCEGSSCMWWCIIYKWWIPLGLCEDLQKQKPIMVLWNDLMDQY